jgi:hypothetical protein
MMIFYGKRKIWPIICVAPKCAKYKQQSIRIRPGVKSSLGNTDVLCFTEHWVKEDYLNEIQIDQYKLVDYFSRKKYEHGGSCIYVKNGIRTRELNYLKDWDVEKESEMSATELADYEAIILCIYRPPDSYFQIFFKDRINIAENTVK